MAGAVLWLAATPFRSDAPTLSVSRGAAIAAAEEALTRRGVKLDAQWRRFAVVRLPGLQDQADQNLYLWREAGPALYRSQVGAYLSPPLWEVRFARFEGDVVERAEEWRIDIDGQGHVRRVRHGLPEGRAGATLDREGALSLAERALATEIATEPSQLSLIESTQKKQPARLDWRFVYADPRVVLGEGGQARAQVDVAGNEVVNVSRFVHVPETWERAERERKSGYLIASYVLAASTGVLALAALVFGVRQWAQHRHDRRLFRVAAGLVFALAVIGLVNSWPQLAMSLRTAEPVLPQLGLRVLGTLLSAVLGAFIIALPVAVGVYAAVTEPPKPIAGRVPPWVAGLSAALFLAGLAASLEWTGVSRAPRWPEYAFAGKAIPALGAMLSGTQVVFAIGLAAFVLAALDRVTHRWSRYRWLAGGGVTLALMAIAAVAAQDPLTGIFAGAVAGGTAALLVYGLLRFDPLTLPAYMVTGPVLGFIESAGRDATSASWVNAAVASVAAIVMAALATRYVQRGRERAMLASREVRVSAP